MEERRSSAGTPVGRRVFLGLIGVGAAGVLLGAQVQDFLERTVGTLVSKDGTGLAGFLPLGRFRFYTVTGQFPKRSRADYMLKVRGLVAEPISLSFADLQSMTPTHLTRDFQCVTGWRVPEVHWSGVRLADVLDAAGASSEARGVRLTSFDGAYTETLTMSQARRNDVILAYQLEGKDLGSAHGGPVRLYVAPMYGYKSLKWLETIEVSNNLPPGYWEERGYDIDAWVGRSNGRTDDAT